MGGDQGERGAAVALQGLMMDRAWRVEMGRRGLRAGARGLFLVVQLTAAPKMIVMQVVFKVMKKYFSWYRRLTRALVGHGGLLPSRLSMASKISMKTNIFVQFRQEDFSSFFGSYFYRARRVRITLDSRPRNL